MDIYAGNLSFDTTEEDLRRVFEAYGEVVSAIVIQDSVSGNASGFGFVQMRDDEEARKAVEALNRATINERSVIVAETRRRGDRRAISRVDAESLNFN
ncbi:MAG: RNA-binding protein [Planctomycetota bacterium]|nr:MAG: RNA-binding protein [Planctomycetota bacterium]